MLRLPRQWETHLEMSCLPGLQSLRRLLDSSFRPWARAAALRIPGKPASGSKLPELTLDAVTLGPVDNDPQPGRSPSTSACELYREFIETAPAKGPNAMAIWQDLVDGHGFGEKYVSVKRLVRAARISHAGSARGH